MLLVSVVLSVLLTVGLNLLLALTRRRAGQWASTWAIRASAAGTACTHRIRRLAVTAP